MAIREHPTKGPGWWQIRISQGYRKPEKNYVFRGTEAEACAFEAEIKGIPQEKADQRMNDVLGRFLDWYTVNKAARTVSEAHKMLPKVIAAVGNKHLSLLRQSDWTRYKQQRLEDGVKKRTINVELSYVRSLLKYARDEIQIPVGDLPKLYTKNQTLPPPTTPLTPEETLRLLGELEGDKRIIVMLYAYCGLRRTEGLTLKRKNIDLQAGLLHVTGKGNKSRIVPIVGKELLELLEHACAGKKNDDWLFPNPQAEKNGAPQQPYKDLRGSLKNAAKRAGISKDVWNHLLRHSGATAAIQAGVSLRELQDILGHTDIRMTEIYTHISADMLKSSASKIAALYDGAQTNTSGISGSRKAEKNNVYQLDRKRKK